MRKTLRLSFLLGCSLLLAGCGLFGAKDNTPKPAKLVNFKPQAKAVAIWSNSTGDGSGSKYLKLGAAYSEGALYTTDYTGQITRTSSKDGYTLWQVQTKLPITTSPAAGGGLVYVGTSNAKVAAVSENTGALAWTAKVSSAVLAAPTYANGMVFVKTIDGNLEALDAETGKKAWGYAQDVPSLVLRGSSSATVDNDQVFAGFANGNLVSLTTDTGSQTWSQTIALPQGDNPIENMVDIDARPIVRAGIVYVVTYQGNIAALNAITGTILWQHGLSSYSSLAVGANNVFSSDSKSHVWAFDQNTGGILWRQQALSYRNITGPVIMGNNIVVGDQEGYLHWLSSKDGHFVARVKASSAKIIAAPLVVNNILYVTTSDGKLAAYELIKKQL